MKLQIERMKRRVDVYRVINTDQNIEARFIDDDAFRIHRNTEVADFLRHLLTDAVFVYGSVLAVASNALNLLLKLILLDVWREHFPGKVEKSYDQKHSK